MSTTQKIQYWALTVGASLLVVWLLWYWISPNRLNGDLPQWQSIPLFLMLSFVMFHRPALEALSWIFHGWALITAALMLGFTLVPTVLTQLSVYLVQVQLRLKATVANWAAQVRVRVREVGVKS